MGVYFQAQDDFLDAFGTYEQIGKHGTDIQDKKCGWLFCNAYNGMVDAAQKKVLDKHYGKCKLGSEEEGRIKQIYRAIGLKEKYEAYEEEVIKRLGLKARQSAVGRLQNAEGVQGVSELFSLGGARSVISRGARVKGVKCAHLVGRDGHDAYSGGGTGGSAPVGLARSLTRTAVDLCVNQPMNRW